MIVLTLSVALWLALADTSPSAVAVVNGQAVSKASFQEALLRRYETIALHDLVDESLLEQEARRLKIRVDLAEIRRRAEAAGGAGNTVAERSLRRACLIDEISRRSTRVSSAEIESFYETNKPFFVATMMVRVRDLVLSTKDNAEQMMELLKAGGDFARLARTFSVDPTSRDRGGDLGWLSIHSLAPALRDCAARMKADEISPPVELGQEWHILKLEAVRPQRQKPLSEVRLEIRQRIYEEKLPMTRHHLLATLRQRASVIVRSKPGSKEP